MQGSYTHRWSQYSKRDRDENRIPEFMVARGLARYDCSYSSLEKIEKETFFRVEHRKDKLLCSAKLRLRASIARQPFVDYHAQFKITSGFYSLV